ncbi:hypothetical protein [Anaeromyxobacter oryzae]|uniref:Uncharacterized protein n=1 Tax=Anaeromyxobacter oryzae TaxID=2918170 RepID=A0ABM7X170_9BACT|nr:hypothetical protein [Anaeromyxobacter oryzae]BDG05517.1 hypothetical protein AMOR_45130 [Anaeromyxobacter oryzae]
MAMQQTGHEASAPTTLRDTPEEKRAELYRIIEEIGNARADRAAVLRARFDELWSELGDEAERKLH